MEAYPTAARFGASLRLVTDPSPIADAVLDVAAVAAKVIAMWTLHMHARGLSERTITERVRVVLSAAARSGEHPCEFTTEGLALFLAGTVKQSTRCTYYSYLSAWSGWLIQTGRRPDDPLVTLPAPRQPHYRPHPITIGQLERLLRTRMHRRARAMILLGAYEGMRVHEIAKVRGEDFTAAGTVRVLGKGGSDEEIPVHPLVGEMVERWPREGWWFPSYKDPTRPVRGNSVSSVISDVMRRAGVPASGHALRHFYGTELVRSGADLRTVQTLLRHRSLTHTAIYTAVADETRAAAVLRLPVPERGGRRLRAVT